MVRLTRSARGAVIAVTLALLVAAPAAAAPPTRTARPLAGGFVLPAGMACAFDVAGDPTGGFRAQTTSAKGGCSCRCARGART